MVSGWWCYSTLEISHKNLRQPYFAILEKTDQQKVLLCNIFSHVTTVQGIKEEESKEITGLKSKKRLGQINRDSNNAVKATY